MLSVPNGGGLSASQAEHEADYYDQHRAITTDQTPTPDLTQLPGRFRQLVK
jgi:hypothetical protein